MAFCCTYSHFRSTTRKRFFNVTVVQNWQVGSCGLEQPNEGTWVFPIACDERNEWQAEWEGKMARGDLDNAVSQIV